MDITEKQIGETIIAMAEQFNARLTSKTESELEQYWHFEWEDSDSLELNIYNFHDMMNHYANFCRRWEKANNGSCCVVERVRDKYIMPKIKEFAKRIKEKS